MVCAWLCLVPTTSADQREAPASPVAIPALRIAVLDNMRINTGGDGASLSAFRSAIDEINDASIDFVLIAGGLTPDGSAGALEAFAGLRELLAPPTYVVPGPTDILDADGDVRAETYREVIGRDYFAARVAPDLQLIGLNGPALLLGGDAVTAQWEWLEKVLDSPFEGYRMLLTHCVHNEHVTGSSVEAAVTDTPSRRLRGLIEGHAIDLVVCGSHVTSDGVTQTVGLLTPPSIHSTGSAWMLLEYEPGKAPRHEIRVPLGDQPAD